MDRRSWGIVLLTAVLVAAIVGPALVGRRIPGIAQASSPPGPAQVGDCVEALPSIRSALDYLPPLLSARTVPCDGVNVGEVVAVSADVDSFPRTTGSGLSRPEVLACDPLMRRYLGWPVPASDDETGAVASTFWDWRPWNTVSSGLIGPDLQQYFAGQRWVACVAYPEFAPFRGSIRDSVLGDGSAVSYAACLPATSVSDWELVSCSQPHQTEILGWSIDSLAADDRTASCLLLVQRVTGMHDPTAGGALRVSVLDSKNKVSSADASSSEVLVDQPICSATVVGQRRLVGTLIGLGDRELPWE